MNILEIIEKKRDKKELSKEEIEYFIEGYTNDKIADYQASALIMAMYLNGMTKQETTDLTIAMANSGEKLDLSRLNEVIVDKHSTGGVGDKVSLILLPLVASLGVPVAKMSGRGLGFTGGTVDKLESIPGYQTGIDIHKFVENVEKVGISMISQTLNLAPADKKIYGAFMQSKEKAEALAEEMIEIGKLANKETVCVLTNMDEPLGYAVGNSLEVIEAIHFLKGDMPEDVKEVVLELGAYMVKLAGKGADIEENKARLLENIENGKGYEKFIQLVENQGGDSSYIKDTNQFSKANYIENVYSQKDGYIQSMNAKAIGKIVCDLGAGRIQKEDSIDNAVGIILNKKVSDKVEKDDVLVTIYANSKEKMEDAKKKVLEVIKIENKEVAKPKMILEIMK